MSLALSLCLGAALAAQQLPGPEASGAQHAFVELATPRDTYYVQESIRLRLRLGFEREFFEENGIQLFHRRLDVPLQLEAPWLENLPGAILLAGEADGPGGPRLSFALGDDRAEAAQVEDRLVEGRTFTVLELERSYLPTTPGPLAIPAPLLRFAYATRFEEDFINGRVPADRREASVTGQPLTLTILPLPAEGRPDEFSGAVGRFAVRAEARARDEGDGLELVLTIEGEGNLGGFEAPRLDGLQGFHVYGRIEERSGTRRAFTYDLAPLAATVREVPPIPFTFFDAGPPAGYRTVRTAPIPLAVPPGADTPQVPDTGAGGASASEAATGSEPAATPPGGADEPGPSWPFFAALLLVSGGLALAFFVWWRAREREGADADRTRTRGAAEAFHARAGDPRADPGEALAEFLAAHLSCPTAAVITPDLATRLEAAGVPAELAARTAAQLAALVAARYGGSAPSRSSPAVRELVDELERSFRGRGGGGPRYRSGGGTGVSSGGGGASSSRIST